MTNEHNQSTQNAATKRAAEKDFSTENINRNQAGSSPAETAKDTAKDIYNQAKETSGQAYSAAADKAKSTLDEQKTNLAVGLTGLADGIKQAGENLREAEDKTGITNITAKYGDSLARQIEQISGYFENKDFREMARDVENFARKNPAVFIGSAFALGLLAARFLKSSPGNISSQQRQNFKKTSSDTEKFNSVSEDKGISTGKTTANPS